MAGYGRIEDEEIVEGLDLWYAKRLGLWNILQYYRVTGKKSRLLKVGLVILTLLFGPVLLFSACGPFYTEKDLEGMTLLILNPMSGIQTVYKYLLLWYGVGMQCQLLELLKSNFLTCVPPDKKPKANAILREAALKGNSLANLSIYVDILTVSFWNIVPILRSDYFNETLGITIFGHSPGKNKIFGYWYPIDVNVTPWAESIYVYEFFICVFAGLTILLSDGMLIQILVLLTANLKVLKYLLEELKSSKDDFGVDTVLQYIKEHQRLIEYGELFRKLFSGMVTLQICTGSIILIITIFNFFLQNSADGHPILMLKFIIYLMYTLVEIAVFCYIAGELETTSSDLGFSAYSSDWYAASQEFKKTTQMIMIRSNFPMTIQFGRMYPLNLVALTSILQSAYSTSMLLYRVTVPEE